MKTKKDTAYFMYKGKPLVRCANTLYYGDMSDDYVIKIDIKSQKKSLDLDVADDVIIQLINMNDQLSISKRIIKVSQKSSLYEAIDIANVWLKRALEDS